MLISSACLFYLCFLGIADHSAEAQTDAAIENLTISFFISRHEQF